MATPRVLVVEDDDSVRLMLQEGLQRDGFEVVVASNVRDALGYIAAEKFDVLLSDLHLPLAGDGFTLVSAMRHAPYASGCVDRDSQRVPGGGRGFARDPVPSR